MYRGDDILLTSRGSWDFNSEISLMDPDKNCTVFDNQLASI